MNLNYYPGCTLHGTARDFHESILAVFEALGVRIVELDDWNCCGASSAHVMHPEAAWRLPARNLLIAAGVDRPLLTPCAACYHRLKLAQYHLQQHPEGHPQARAATAVDVVHVNDMLLKDELLRRIKERIRAPLTGLRVVPYYGCLTVRPPQAIKHPRPEDPVEMDGLLRLLGADVVTWSYKTDCCGGNHALTRPDLVRMLSGKLFEAAREAGGEVIVTDCPMCQANLDTRQREIEREQRTSFRMPVLYITEVLAIAMGLPQTETWWRKHLVDPVPVLKSKGWAA
ncbi:MAG: CoB--CoM heterodisulfide reductase iron-sulfur subunit B family protein [Deltaproteobacteria bacterium]|nr:CoB--CoM heterodisulfide reductase iron-sulfur subunit B family protein [Deltaproteobacteria bacterium]